MPQVDHNGPNQKTARLDLRFSYFYIFMQEAYSKV